MGMVLACDCKHSFQDSVYGPGKRYHLRCQKEGKYLGDRCSVCGTKKAPISAEPKKVKK